MTATDIQARLRSLGNPREAAFLAGFFKTGPGQYGEGDVFLGLRVPVVRKVAREFGTLPLDEAESLLHSPIHEERLAALVILTMQAAKGDAAGRKRIYDFYLANTRYVNNWDLVDLSAPQIVGAHLAGRSRRPLYRLACSRWLWDRRIAILATFHFVRQMDFADTLRIAELLLNDEHDLLHKAVGWMLREVGKRDVAVLEGFLARHCRTMPRTMLRYAIERLPESKRREYMAAKRKRKQTAAVPDKRRRLTGRDMGDSSVDLIRQDRER
jgi:3-methyladenine DNA glycosylase AlkD